MPSSTFLNLPAEKQEKLLEAATREFSHRPFNEASINQIIKEAGIPRGSFYMYFQDKEDLFRYLLKGYVDQLFMLLEEFLLRNGGDIFQALLDLYDYVQAKIDNQHLGEIGAMTGIIRCNSGMQKNGLLEMLDAETLLQRLGGAVNPDLLDLRQDRDLGDILGTLRQETEARAENSDYFGSGDRHCGGLRVQTDQKRQHPTQQQLSGVHRHPAGSDGQRLRHRHAAAGGLLQRHHPALRRYRQRSL